MAFQIPARPVLSDDTELTLATCESIIESGRIDPAALASRFSRWFLEGRVHGMGSSTLKALRDLAVGTHWALAGAVGEFAAGGGAAMRVAPLSFLLNPTDAQDRIVIRDVCRITHHSDEAYAGALAVVLAIHSVLAGSWSEDRSFLEATTDGLPDSRVRDRCESLISECHWRGRRYRYHRLDSRAACGNGCGLVWHPAKSRRRYRRFERTHIYR